MKKQVLYLLAVAAVAATVFVLGCQKETSFEGSNNPAKGSLQSDVTGDCLPKTVNGIYAAGTALIPATNTMTVQVNVTQTGTYVVTTDTINGYFFRAVGTFTTLGPVTVTLRGNGTPFAGPRTDNFVVSFDGTVCDIAVDVLPAGAGAAVFTMNCAGAAVNGPALQVGTNLTAANTITIPVTAITTPGTYTFTNLTINGMTWNGSGNLTTLPATITLNPVTTTSPAMAGTNNLAVGACTVPVTATAVAGGAVFTLNCGAATVDGPPLQVGTNLTAANTITIPVATITTAGTYTFSNLTINGMTWNGSGNLTTLPATITLNPVTTTSPTNPGTNNLIVGSCSIPVTATAGVAQFALVPGGTPSNCAGATVNGAYVVSTGLVAVTNYIDITVTVTQVGTYSAISAQGGGMIFTKAAGTFSTLGNQTVRLDGTGTAPGTTGNQAVTFTAPASFNTCSFNVYVLANDYFPRTNGSNWSYEFDDHANDSLLRYVNPAPFSNGANSFTIFMQNDGSGADSSGYYRRNSGDYFEWFDWSAFISGLDAPVWTEYIMLKDNVPASPAAGSNWKTGASFVSAGGTPIGLRFSYTVLSKDVPITLTTSTSPPGGTVYQNVIVLQEKLDFSLDGGATWNDATTTIHYYGKSYYARGVGLIKFEAFDENNVSQGLQELRRWQVN